MLIIYYMNNSVIWINRIKKFHLHTLNILIIIIMNIFIYIERERDESEDKKINQW